MEAFSHTSKTDERDNAIATARTSARRCLLRLGADLLRSRWPHLSPFPSLETTGRINPDLGRREMFFGGPVNYLEYHAAAELNPLENRQFLANVTMPSGALVHRRAPRLCTPCAY